MNYFFFSLTCTHQTVFPLLDTEITDLKLIKLMNSENILLAKNQVRQSRCQASQMLRHFETANEEAFILTTIFLFSRPLALCYRS